MIFFAAGWPRLQQVRLSLLAVNILTQALPGSSVLPARRIPKLLAQRGFSEAIGHYRRVRAMLFKAIIGADASSITPARCKKRR